jgi:hypothetical protein
MHAKLQVLLTRKDLHLSPEPEGLVRFVYEQSKKLESLVDKLPSW